MNKYLLLLLLIPFTVFGQGADPVWERDFTFGGNQGDKLASVYQTEDLAIIMGGTSYSNNNQDVTQSNNGGADFWVIEYDSTDNIRFSITYGSGQDDIMAEMIETGDGGYLLAGSSNSGPGGDKTSVSKGDFDYWILKIDKDGNKLWDATYGGDSIDILTTAVVDDDGGFVLAGYSYSDDTGDKSDTTRGSCDYWIIKTDATGNVIWNKSFGGDSVDIAKGITVIDGYQILGHSKSDITGDKTIANYGGFDYWFLSLDQNGNEISQQAFGGNQDDISDKMLRNSKSQSFLLAGTSNSVNSGNKNSGSYGNEDFWFVGLDSSMTMQWQSTMGGSASDIFADAVETVEGSYVFIGTSNSGATGSKTAGNQGGSDYWIIKSSSTGGQYWDRAYGGSANDTATWVFQTCDRGYLGGGYSDSDISGDKTTDSKGTVDYWTWKLHVPTIPFFNSQTVCLGTPMSFYDETDIWPDKWNWDFGDHLVSPENNTSDDQHPQHTYSAAGVYDVTLTVQEECQNDTTIVRKVTVLENPILGEVDLGPDETICYGETRTLVNLEAPLPPGSEIVWSTGDSTETILVDTIGIYTMTVTNGQCVEMDQIELDYCPVIYIPNAFTPNGDNYNDLFFTYGIGFREFELLIFDRWGNLIFQTNDQYEGWDGTYKNNPAQIDVYVYKVRFKGINTEEDIRIGHVSLIR